MAQQHTNQRQRGNAALQQAALSTLPLQSSLQVSRKLDCTKPPIKDAQPLPGRAQGAARAPGESDTSGEPSAPGANAARKDTGGKSGADETGDNLSGVTNQALKGDTNVTHKSRVTRACVTLKQAEKITCLSPSHGTEKASIAPPPGTEEHLPVPPPGAISPIFDAFSVPSPGHHLEKPSVPRFKPGTSEKFSASHHVDSSTTFKKKQPALFTGGAPLCYIGTVTSVKRDRDWSPDVLSATKAAVTAFGLRLCYLRPFYGGSTGKRKLGRFPQGVPGRPTCRATAPIGLGAVVFEPHSLEAIMATSFNALTSESVTPTNALHSASPTTGTPDPIQLHADAHNALNMAVFYLRQPDANVAGARRKAIQALTALRGLSLALEG